MKSMKQHKNSLKQNIWATVNCVGLHWRMWKIAQVTVGATPPQ
jgi:hypothetical protein